MADLQDLLLKSSRTFALSIPLLPEPTANEVCIAYLLFRIADTFEDSTAWSQERRVEALQDFKALLDQPEAERCAELARRWTDQPPCDHEGYLELLSEVPAVMAAFSQLTPEAREQVRLHTARTADGMMIYVARTDDRGTLRLEDVADLQAYCYIVAGIVGEMLTELFLLGTEELEPVAVELRQRARAFGEGLQLVNILKDAASDADEGRTYLPADTERKDVFALARRDLGTASDYTQILQRSGAPEGVVAFCALPVLLAWGTLARVEEKGAGAKLTRPEVFAITMAMNHALQNDQPVIPLEVREQPIPPT
ncbi:MAG: squalene/phytoene synthase family protein [Deltaproteobacteria bacterium]|nr:squalene/phytoene synthase family protein [Deltaproteobacteria bacterium]